MTLNDKSDMQRPDSNPTHRPGFTVIELLVVISIMVILLAALAPAIFSIDADSRLVAGVNTVDAGTRAARALSIKRRASVLDIPAAVDSGVALIFTPAGEMRLAGNNQRAENGAGQELESSGYNGYSDMVGREYIVLPKGIAVAGIVGPDPAGNPAHLVPPPFAIRFDGQGSLIAGYDASNPANSADELVVYDGAGPGEAGTITSAQAASNGVYDWTKTRPSGYDPKAYDPDSTSANLIGIDGKTVLPFEALEPAIGVIVYSKGDFEDANLNWASGASDAVDWLTRVDTRTGQLLNGKLLLVGRSSGVASN